MNQQLDWKSAEFRAKCVQEMEKILSKNPSTNISARDLENRIFQKATTKEDYVTYVKACLTKVPQPSGIGAPASMQMANRAHQPAAQGMGAAPPNVQAQMYSGGDMQQQPPPQSAGPPGQMNMMSGQAPSSGQNFGGMMPGYQNQQPQQQQQQQPGMGQFSGQQPGPGYAQQQGQHGGGMMINQMGQQRQMMMPSGGMMAGQPGMMQRQPMQFSQTNQPGMRPGYPEGMQLRTSNMTPELRQQLIQQHTQQQERLRMERANIAMVMRDNPGTMNPGGQPFNNQPGYPGGMPPRMGGMMSQQGQAAPGQPNQPSLLTQLIQAPVPSSPQFRPSGPVGQGQPGASNQSEIMGAVARPPSVVSFPAKSSPMGMSGPPSNQPVLAPSPAPEINPETVQTGSELYKKKLEELQKHKDMIQKMIAKFQNDPERSGQLNRLKGLQSLIYEKQAVPYPVLVKCENIIKNFCGSQLMGLNEPLSSSPTDEKTPGSIPGLTPLIGAGSAADALVRVDRSSLKPVAEALSRALTELNDEQFAALCQAWRARMPGSLDDGVVWRSGMGHVDEEDELPHPGGSDADDATADDAATMDEKSKLAKWKAEIPAALQREASQLHSDFHIILDVDMHPDGELLPDEPVLYLCCGLKQTAPNRAVVPPVGVVVPLDYPSTLIDFRNMDVAAYEGSRFLQEVREAMREKFTGLGGAAGCSLVALLHLWRQSVEGVQNRG